MIANISIDESYHGDFLKFFLSKKSLNEFEKLVDDSIDIDELFDCIEKRFEYMDEFEDYLYENSHEDIKEYLGIELFK